MAESVRRVYYRSDFDFIARLMVSDAGGGESELGFPAYDWRLFLRRTRGAPFVASSIGGVLTNCVNDGGRIRIICKDHDFVPGRLFGEMCCYIPNPIYPEGLQTVVSKHRLGIELVEDDANDATAIVAELQLPIVATGEGGIQDLSGYLTKIEAISLYQPKGDYATAGQLSAKQDALTPGDGISIEKNVISCTLDTSLYKVVVSLPESGEENKIYLVESNEQGEQNIYTEYGYINGKWETLGQYRAEVNLAPYLTKDDAVRSYQPKGDYALREELPAVPTKVSELENDEQFVSVDDIPESETYVLDFTIADGVNTGTFTPEQYNPLRAAIEAGKLIIVGGKVTRVTADSQAMAADYVVIRYATPRISDDNKSVTFSVYELKFSATEYTSKAIHKVIS